ncbi:MAG: hypothetical protein IT211_07715, partial [Armatimonadetes bacterium]|nr:hypothetical protein [Armatimonadota bacterium]
GTSEIATGAVTTAEILDGTVAPVDMSSAGALNDQALIFNGASVVWGYPTADQLVLPFAQTATNAAALFSITQLGGAGDVTNFVYNAPGGPGNALEATSNGAAPTIMSTNTDGAPAITAVNSGTGPGVTSQSINGNAFMGVVTGSGNGMNLTMNGTGTGVAVATNGTGSSATFQNNNGGNAAPTVSITSNANPGNALLVQATGDGGNAVVASANGNATSTTVMASNTGAGRAGHFDNTQPTNANTIVRAQSAGNTGSVPGQDAFPFPIGNAGVDVALTNAAASGAAVQSTQAGTGLAGRFEATGNGSGVYITTNDAANKGGLWVNRGGIVMPYRSVAANYTVQLDDAYIRIQDNGVPATTFSVTLPAGLQDGQTIWVYNGDVDALAQGVGGLLGVVNGTGAPFVGFNISPWRGCQFVYISALGGWVPMSNM